MEKSDTQPPKEDKDSKQSEEKFKKGDYSVHIFIEESKGLLPVTPDKNFNPVITVKCFGKVKCTRKLKDVTSGATSLWGEHLYFSKLNCTVNDIESEKVLIEVKDSKTLKDALIGSYELDFTYVYFQPKHSIIHQWIVLSNPYSEDISVQRGLLKIGVNISHENDKAEDLTAKGVTETLIVPPQVNVKSVQLVVQLIKALNLPKMDTNGTCDAYCIVSFGNVKNKTKVITTDKGSMSASWLTELWLPVCQPCISNRVNITIFDQDTIGDDELVGSLSFNWDNIQEESKSPYFWKSIYGGPENLSNEKAIEMNQNDKIASHYRGKILMRMFKKQTEKALLKSISIDTPEFRDISQRHETFETYNLAMQVLEAVNLPFKTGSYSIKIKIQDAFKPTKPSEATAGSARWNENLGRMTADVFPGSEFPDIFVYLIYDKQPICFARLQAEKFRDPKPTEKWVKLTPDAAIGKVSNPWEGGYVLLKLFFFEESDKSYEKKYWDILPQQVSPKTTKKLVCNLYQCKDLPAADPTGLSDPYVKVMCGSSEYSTDKKAKLGTLNPSWYESFVLDVSMSSIQAAPPVIIQVWDYDAGSSDDIMGICELDLSSVPLNPSDAPRPTWHKLSLGSEDSEEGEILISLLLVDSVVPRLYMPELVEVSIEIYALGFRDLKPALGWLPVNKAFLKIDLSSIQMPGEQTLVTELSTQPNSPGPNPNISAVLTAKVKIPKDPLYCPNLTCTVYDFLLSGKSQPILGNFILDLHETYQKQINSKKAEKLVIPSFVKPVVNERVEEVKEEEKIEEQEVEEMENIQEFFKNKGKTMTFAHLDNESEDQVMLTSVRKTTVFPEKIMIEEPKRGSFSVQPLSMSEAHQPGFVVVMPQFKQSSSKGKQVEVKLKDSHYLALGYNRSPNDNKKHYRYCLDTSYEKSNLFGEPPFQVYQIKKGQNRGDAGGFFSFGKNKTHEDSSITNAGVFKGLIRIKNLENDSKSAEKEDSFDKISKLLLVKMECVVRIYLVDALDLEQKDLDSPSDPYVVIKLGKTKINDRDNAIMDNACPKFLKHFDLTTTFPGESTLKVQVWDQDDLFSDDKIGTTKIDLEDRYFNDYWKNMPEKPIEVRKLLIKSCKQSQGTIRLWVEIHPANNIPPPWDLSPRPPEKFELRLVVWKCEGVPNQDIEGVSDLYLVASLNNENKKETDTHYRAQNGVASWNWRIKFPMLVDENAKCILNLSLWDRDLLSSNDAIGDACLDLSDLAAKAFETGEKVKKLGPSESLAERAMRRENEKFFVEFTTKDENGKVSSVGKVQISIEILPESAAKACLNGEGRNEPNVEPFLPAPEGRIEFTMNPVKMFNQMVGAELRRKICCYICVGLCLFLFVMMLPMLVSNIFANIIS